MKKNISANTIYFLVLLLAINGCRAKKVILPQTVIPEFQAATVAPDSTRKNKLDSIQRNNMMFNTLAIKSKSVLSINDKSNEVNMNFRIRNNEVIWVSVTAIAGLEIARALITPDSVKILNRMDNIYINKPFSYIHEFTNEQINFRTLQSILLGNTVSEFISDSTELKIENEETILKSTLGVLSYNLWINPENKVVHTNLNDEVEKQELSARYSDFIMINQQLIPHSIIMDSQVQSKKFLLELKFLKVDLDGILELPFRVPDRFLIKN